MEVCGKIRGLVDYYEICGAKFQKFFGEFKPAAESSARDGHIPSANLAIFGGVVQAWLPSTVVAAICSCYATIIGD